MATGYKAVNAVTGLYSTRGYARLRTLDTVAAPRSSQLEVTELRKTLAGTAA